MQPNAWAQLSVSSQNTLLWASALANLRAEEDKNSTAVAEINAFDIFVGMLLEHPQDAESKALLQHFHLTPGQILPIEYPRVSKEAIERNLHLVTSESAMLLDPDAQSIVDAGIKMGLSSGNSDVSDLNEPRQSRGLIRPWPRT